MLIAIIDPLNAPQILHVLDIPPQNPDAIFGINSEWIFFASQTARRTLSAQKNPDSNSSELLFSTVFVIYYL